MPRGIAGSEQNLYCHGERRGTWKSRQELNVTPIFEQSTSIKPNIALLNITAKCLKQVDDFENYDKKEY